ncbi:hypothetical protein PTE30175_02515 [Pandoraea terrae]|uniref:Uncharacterized protein n=2 Tax=Pandoraea terrae TaxID=1537710 RepID=A0A5E4VGK5_9BURK|nr:hypothetical protein PTE30175_02515 [Pandoraea terrae]
MALLLATVGAHAEPQQAAPQTAPVLVYSSAFASYKGYADQPVTPWREANDTVGRIGGWRSYAKEAAQETSPAAPAGAASASAPSSHDAGHGAHLGSRP